MVRIGKYSEGGKRPILVKLTKENVRMGILKKTRNLKGTSIGIDEDYPKNIQEERKSLIPHMKEARNRGYRAFLRYNKLIVDNKVYRMEDLERKEGVKCNDDEVENTGQKRTAQERSPEGSTEQQICKITKTMERKN